MARRPLRAWAVRLGKWAGLVACSLLLAAWGASWRWDISRDDCRKGSRLSVLRVRDGCLVVTWITDPEWSWSSGDLEWWARERDPQPVMVAAPPPPPTIGRRIRTSDGALRGAASTPVPRPGSGTDAVVRTIIDEGRQYAAELLAASEARGGGYNQITAPPPPFAPAAPIVQGRPWWDPTTLDWWPRLHPIKWVPMMTCKVPLWLVFAFAACGTSFLWWLQPRFWRAGCCRACGYDLAGLGRGAVCPECGAHEGRRARQVG